MDEDKTAREIQAGADAEALLNGAYFQMLVEYVKDGAWKQFATSVLNDDHARLEARIRVEMLDQMLAKIKTDIQTGKFNLADLEEENG